jgi:NADPH-dependent 2,4-dienoyl-CoA reductase/sulfur reductase-like enzyme
MRGDATHSLEEARSKLKSMQGDVAKAQKVVIIGAGPVGLEYAGVCPTLSCTATERS